MTKLEEKLFDLTEYLKICNPEKRWFVERQIGSVKKAIEYYLGKNKTEVKIEPVDETYEMAKGLFGITETAVH